MLYSPPAHSAPTVLCNKNYDRENLFLHRYIFIRLYWELRLKFYVVFIMESNLWNCPVIKPRIVKVFPCHRNKCDFPHSIQTNNEIHHVPKTNSFGLIEWEYPVCRPHNYVLISTTASQDSFIGTAFKKGEWDLVKACQSHHNAMREYT